MDWNAAQPSFDGLGGNKSAALENTISLAVSAAGDLAPGRTDLTGALLELSERFRAGIRRSFQPRAEEEGGKRRRRKKKPNAGRRVRAAIDRIGDAYVALCLETGTVYDLNPAAEALFGAETEDLLAREFSELIAAEERGNYRNLEARLDAGEDAAPMTMRIRRLNGEIVSVELAAVNHTIGGRRLAILSVRERAELAESSYSTRTTSSAGISATSAVTARST